MAFGKEEGERKKAIALFVLGIFTICGGISFIVLGDSLVKAVVEGTLRKSSYHGHVGVVVWWYAFLYILPGIMSCLAGGLYNKNLHISNVVFTSISVGLGGVHVIYVITVNTVVSSLCYVDFHLCKRVGSLISAITGVVIVTWICILVCLILSGTEGCCCVRSAVSQGVVVGRPGDTVPIVTATNTVAGIPNPGYFVLQTDNVHNSSYPPKAGHSNNAGLPGQVISPPAYAYPPVAVHPPAYNAHNTEKASLAV